ncbi:hypothetical protein KDA14_03850, partial [Candidatus Saccharibacteria bacterium]|nr:hypothetical protein [Candidatus Saccharibacteria bacterium]
MATKSKAKPSAKVKIQKRNRLIPILFVGFFAVIGIAFLLRAFAATSSVKYFGVLTKDNPSVSYKVSTGAGNLDIAYSNNTADLTLVVANSKGVTVGSVLSKGKKDVSLSIPVTPDTYSFTISQEGGFSGGRKGYKLYIAYPTKDLTNPIAAITNPSNTEALKGAVAFSASSSDDTGVQKVEFYVDTKLIATDASSPYSTTWDTTTSPDGSHSLTVKAYDTSGNVGTASASVTVQNKVV